TGVGVAQLLSQWTGSGWGTSNSVASHRLFPVARSRHTVRNDTCSAICMSSDLILVRTTPFSTAVVSQICLPRMISEERPRPMTRTFHAILLVSLQAIGGSACGAQPLPAGPRNCGQSRAEQEVTRSRVAIIASAGEGFHVACSVFRVPC